MDLILGDRSVPVLVVHSIKLLLVISDWILTQLIAANEAQNKDKATKAMEDERFNAIQLDFIEITVIFHKVKVLFGRFVTNVGRTSSRYK